MNPTDKPAIIEFGGEKRKLYFNLNTFTEFEKNTDKFFLDFLASMQEAVQEGQDVRDKIADDPTLTDAARTRAIAKANMILFRRFSMQDFQAFLHAAMHEYGKVKGDPDAPVWPFAISTIGRMVDINNIYTLAVSVLKANADNAAPIGDEDSPKKEDGVNGSPRPTLKAVPTVADGGQSFGPSDAMLLDSMTTKSED